MPVTAAHDTVLVLDFGSQYSQLIARRVREAKVYCELVRGTIDADEVKRRNPRGLIFGGGPASVYDEDAPKPDPAIYDLGLPILGICYGMQLLAHDLGGEVEPAERREYGLASLVVDETSGLFDRLPAELPVWMSHGDIITRLPPGFRAVAHSLNSPCAAMAGPGGRLGIQFHPEVVHTPLGREILRNFLYQVCGCSGTWEPASFIDMAVTDIRTRVGDGRVLCALSGGVDSAVAATLVHRAIGDQLTCVFVDNGLLRRAESDRVVDIMSRQRHIDLVHVDASDRFLDALSGVVDPEEKRRRIGRTFIEVFETEARRLGRVDFLATGKDHIFARINGFTFKNNYTLASGTTDPSSAYYATRDNYTILGDWNRAINSTTVNDLHVDFSHFQWQNLPIYASQAITFGTVTVGAPYNYPQIFYQDVQEYRDDLFYLFT